MRRGYTLNPPHSSMSLVRSTIKIYPSSSMYPTSPVRRKPSLVIVSWVASARFQYPFMTLGPPMQISPFSPRATSRSAPFDRRQIEIFDAGMVDDRDVHRRYARKDRNLLLANILDDCSGVEPGVQDHLCADADT